MNKLVITMATALVVLVSTSDAMAQHKLESWYLYFGLGYADPQYGDDVDRALDNFDDQPNITHASVGVDLLGLYWPIGGAGKTVIGGIINTFGDRYEEDNTNVSFQLTGVTIALSTMHYLTNEIGRGLFLRADAGPARFAADVDGGGLSVSDRSEWGFGALVGAGYGLPISSGTRLLFNVNYAFRRVEDETIGALAVTVGGLF